MELGFFLPSFCPVHRTSRLAVASSAARRVTRSPHLNHHHSLGCGNMRSIAKQPAFAAPHRKRNANIKCPVRSGPLHRLTCLRRCGPWRTPSLQDTSSPNGPDGPAPCTLSIGAPNQPGTSGTWPRKSGKNYYHPFSAHVSVLLCRLAKGETGTVLTHRSDKFNYPLLVLVAAKANFISAIGTARAYVRER